MKRLLQLLLLILLAASLFSCGGGGGGSGKTVPKFESGDNEITDFRFTAAKNAGMLPADASGEISGDNITIVVPYSTSVVSLVAEFTTNCTDIQVNGLMQINGETPNDFTSPVIYNATAEDGTPREYTVTVIKAPSPEKELTEFYINGTSGEIDQAGGTVKVTLPPGSLLTGGIASFSAICAKIEVNGIVQASGVTANDFTSPLTYRVFAEDGSSRDYTVTAEVMLSSWKDITTFVFRKSENDALPADVQGTITSGVISAEIPFGSDPSGLIPFFTTSGVKVMIGETEQLAGVTENNYSDTVIYKVIAEDGSEQLYDVNVSVAKSGAKDITKYRLDGEDALIDQGNSTIHLEFPAVKDLSYLIADFITTGVSVKAGNREQVSGITPNDFTVPFVYTVTADNGTSAYYTVSINRNAAIPGLWNFEQLDGSDYTRYGATLTEGLSGNALKFDGYDDYVIIPDSDSLTLAESGSLEVVLKVVAHRAYAGIVHKGVKKDFSDESYSLQYWGNDGTLRFLVTGESGVYSYADSSSKLETGVWYHIVATWDRSDVKLYINGSLSGSAQNKVAPVRDSSGGLVVGAQLADLWYNSSYRNFSFNGIIDRVQVFSSALTQDEVSVRYSRIINPEGSPLTAFLLRVVPQKRGIIIIVFICVLFAISGLYIFNRLRHRHS